MDKERHVVGLVQVNNGFSGQHYLPYSVGVLEAFARANLKNPEAFEFLAPIYCREAVETAAEKLRGADIAGFSLYVWNEQISLAIARELKARSPETLIVMGGPQVPDRAQEFLEEHAFVDVAAHGEGEEVFTAILEHLDGRKFEEVPGVSFRKDGGVVVTPRPKRITDLDRVPSPYLTGIFDRLMTAHPDHKWIAMWETNRGCPFRCTFCDWGSATAQKVYGAGMDRLLKEVDWFAEREISYVFTADANFGIMDRDVELARHCAEVKARTGYPARLSVQSTKSGRLGSKLTERAFETQKILSDSGLNQGVVVSMQSIDAETLKAIKRENISIDAFKEIQNRFNAAGVETMTDLILGLPGETYDSFVNGVSDLIAGGQHNRIQFNNLAILPNAEMGDPAYQAKYGMETVRSRIINIHGYREESAGEIDEYQKLVIATESMPREEWVKTRVFAWMSAFLHFDKLLQIPLMLTHEATGASYRTVIERFMGTTDEFWLFYPTLHRILLFFIAKAREIQAGGEEYCHSPEWLDIWWPADEYAFIDLVARNEFDEFYREAEELLRVEFAMQGPPEFAEMLSDAVALNHALVKIPSAATDLDLRLSWNMADFRRRVMSGEKAMPERREFLYVIDRTSEQWQSLEAWCREVVWYGNKRGAYLYGNARMEQLAGHF
jgi:radical SAM superfamily enzyme YgiQ (UPF0313 family)